MRKAKTKRTAKKTVKKRVAHGARAWTSADVALLRKYYLTTPTGRITKKLKRTVASVKAKARLLHLKTAVRRKAVKKKASKRTKAKPRAFRPGGEGTGRGHTAKKAFHKKRR